MADSAFDIVIIGAGPGGYVAAIRAAQLGMRVACVEKEEALGGTCLRVGCIPSKALLDSSELYFEAAHRFAEHGIGTDGLALDLAKMLKRKDKVVTTLTKGVAGLFKKHGIVHVRGRATLLGGGRVRVDGPDAGELHAPHIVIATGSVPVQLQGLEFDGEHVVDSTAALSFTTVPERLVVVGGGAIGLELGSVWSRLGSDVHVVELADRIVPSMDAELSNALRKVLENQGLRFSLGARVTAVKPGNQGVVVTISGPKGQVSETATRVLVAVGRRPYTDGLGLEAAGVEVDERGRIVVDARFRTSADGVYAIGDVIAGPMLAHKAEEDGIACVELIAGHAGHVDYSLVPGVVYTHPEVAWVGLTEEAARMQGEVRVGRFPLLANGRARAAGASDGLVKIVADAATDRVLGVHILAPRAADMIAQAVTAMEFAASAEDIARTCHAHPTYAEAVKEAALDVGGRVIHR